MVRKISGKSHLSVQHLLKNDIKITDPKEICNTLGESFAKNSSSENYTPKFQIFKQRAERQRVDFKSDNLECYNKLFTIKELKNSLKRSSDTSPGLDSIHYQLLKHLPEQCLFILLNIFNYIWSSDTFPNIWRKACIIPIPKPGKDHKIPTNYRPIALTSCVCKTMERMVNARLVWYLETKHFITRYQSGFRKQRSTLDHLIRFETFIREAFVKKQHMVSIFFDLEKAYDTTWKYGILRDLQDMDLKGHLPTFVSNFLKDRHFSVRVGNTFSQDFTQEMGVPQGSILSTTLFNVKINSIVKCLKVGVECSLYVDDLLICYASKNMHIIERQLQQCLNNLQTWCDENGFKFSPAKTVCMHFCRQRKLHLDPELYLNNIPLPVVPEAKFLGLLFDSKLTFVPHIKKLKTKCTKALNLIKVVANTDWGADRKVLLRLYRSLVRSKLDYGSIVYGAACKSYIKILDPIHNQGLRLCLGAFRTSPADSLCVEANEPPLEYRRIRLGLQYVAQLMSNESNPAHNLVLKPRWVELFDNSPRAIKPLGLRLRAHMAEVGFEPNSTARVEFPKIPPWTMKTPRISFDMSFAKKEVVDPSVFRSRFHEIRDSLPEHLDIYTDGSKEGVRVGCAFVARKFVFSRRLPDRMSVFSAELVALFLALSFIRKHMRFKKFAVFSDSMSSLQALLDVRRHSLVMKILELHEHICNSGKEVVFYWLPSHVGIPGNERADLAAKDALGKGVIDILFPHTDLKQYIGNYVTALWQTYWDSQVNNKLQSIKPLLGDWSKAYRSVRKEEVTLCRTRIGHSQLTHGFLLKGEEAPQCVSCQCPLTVRHILLECEDLDFIRNSYFDVVSLQELFTETDYTQIVSFLRAITVYRLL